MTLGQAINRAMRHSSIGKQVVLADALGVDQTAVSKMIRGKVAVTVERVAEIEDLCEVPRGQILVWAGYVSDDALVDELVDELDDGRLSDRKVASLMAALEASVAAAKATRTRHASLPDELVAEARLPQATGTHGADLPLAATSGQARKPAKRPSHRPRPRPNE